MKNKHQKPLSKKKLMLAALPIFLVLLAAVYFVFFQNDGQDFASDGLLRVCIDPGHGGDDPGATSSDGLRLEKDDCLALALAVEACLAADRPDIEIVMTRRDDTYPSLEERCDIANDFRSDLFVSIHRNSAKGASGTEIWIHKDQPQLDKRLADDILSRLDKVGLSANRGVKRGTASNPDGNYYVNSNTDMPSCLIEMGFITSQEDNLLLDQNLGAYAQAISDAIANMLTP